ncbi:hypothetical protein GCM10010156_59500 [Planobispora rosea]|uniref:Uncharacterized protein n=1 Tax=Planobispora rosea TaxID=35762 RepID=A0A8J3S790_PLARO|nr:hypothetical protein GCM10010156_59500 [Planobispora rosea]GIH87252.1 hypothetical protein Pro02_56600 [Planobispora rosea]
MPGAPVVLRRMPVLGGIAAADMAARQAQPQVDPEITDCETVFAAVRARGHPLDLVEVCAFAHEEPFRAKLRADNSLGRGGGLRRADLTESVG